MKTWTPLWSTLVSSSVWGETKEVKILWITMLAIKDKNGVVECSVPGLARLAVLTIEETEAALKVLESPDLHSRSKNDDGRRIRTLPNGWELINYKYYRDEIGDQYRREYQRKKQAEYRLARKRGKGPTHNELSYLKAVEEGDEEAAQRILDRSASLSQVPNGAIEPGKPKSS